MERAVAKQFGSHWAASLALLLPVIVLYACEYLGGNAGSFSGFIQYDQASYMADAREFFDGGFHPLYGNPFSFDANTPAIYFQAHLFVLGLIERLTGGDPGTVYVCFGFVAALVCVRVAMALYEQVAGLRTPAQWMGLVLFIWGGGVITLASLVYSAMKPGVLTMADLFRLEPDDGWWFLNLGRNLVFPTEAYYHAVALGAVLMAMRRRFVASLWLALLLSWSHPFTGFQFLLILLAWAMTESVVIRSRSVPFLFMGVLLCLLFWHLLYYVVLLNLFPEHHAVFAQWSIPWTEPAVTSICADLLVAALLLYAMRSVPAARNLFAYPTNRLLLAWLIVSLMLAHHDLFAAPRQPLHFSRGYTWIPLFLLGVKPLLAMLEWACEQPYRIAQSAVLAVVLGLGLGDNEAWIGAHALSAAMPGRAPLAPDGFRIEAADRELFAWLMAQPQPHREILLSPDPDLPELYLATVYTDYRAWCSHYASTPFAVQRWQEIRAFARDGKLTPNLRGHDLYLIVSVGSPYCSKPLGSEGEVVHANSAYFVKKILAR